MYFACYDNDIIQLNELINKGMTNWNDGLHGAAAGGHIELLRLMLSKGADSTKYAMYNACEGDHVQIVTLLINHGVDVNHTFIMACTKNAINVVKELIENHNGYDINTGIYSASTQGNMDIVHLLLIHGASRNWALAGACCGGDIGIITQMVSIGAKDWDFGLYGACAGGNVPAAYMMISRGATAWNFALGSACKCGEIQCINLMIAYGATNCHNCHRAH